MKLPQRFAIILLSILMCGLSTYTAANSDLFGFEWPSTPQKLIEKNGWPAENTKLSYIETIEGQDYTATYSFRDGILSLVSYMAIGELEDLPDMLSGHNKTRDAFPKQNQKWTWGFVLVRRSI